MADEHRDPANDAQQRVDAHFSSVSRYWRDIYGEETVFAVIHQDRRDTVLRWIDELKLPPGSRFVEVGCGAGVLAVDLARRGYTVDCIDTVPSMVDLAREQVVQAGVQSQVSVKVGDAHDLQFPTGAYDVVVALGVLPFLHSPMVALMEMKRVVRANGYVLLNSDNLFRLVHVLDPRFTPFLAPVKKLAIRLIGGGWDVPASRHSNAALKRMFSGAGLEIVKWRTLGFGPFTLLGREPFTEAASIRLHRTLQRSADRGAPLLGAMGAQQIVLARRCADSRSAAAD